MEGWEQDVENMDGGADGRKMNDILASRPVERLTDADSVTEYNGPHYIANRYHRCLRGLSGGMSGGCWSAFRQNGVSPGPHDDDGRSLVATEFDRLT